MDVDSLYQALLAHAGSPSVIALGILAATFVLEDVASVAAALLAAAGVIAPGLALAALFAGIVLGDLGLYGLGRLATRNPFARRILRRQGLIQARGWMDSRLFASVFGARFVPGARLPTYTASGFLGLSFLRFALAAVIASVIWTSGLFAVIYSFGALVWQELGPWRWAAAAALLSCAIVLPRLWVRFGQVTQRG
jgi:membrane protein DedA with SNARE-associated domain